MARVACLLRAALQAQHVLYAAQIAKGTSADVGLGIAGAGTRRRLNAALRHLARGAAQLDKLVSALDHGILRIGRSHAAAS